ncbi:hypothetical protein [Jannaschia sp. M317]|uniref:hypothetical protein n=1 Tax=Jannaschia sp. M317 TaxID=2867011 RepID=UPI0021A34691|nr:hypothetical protein [Jannaschia sp. M317]UWQ19237.1 hypothetical protein K3551_08205 [Jannaschia sp. M317]
MSAPPSINKKTANFAGIFLVINLVFDVYRAGGITLGAIASAVLVTVLATAAYYAFLRFTAPKED